MNQNPRVSEIYREITSATVSEGSPEKISSIIQPIIDLSPPANETVFPNLVSLSGSGSMTIAPGVQGRRYKIHAIAITLYKDVASDAASGNFIVQCVINGGVVTIASVPIITLTAQELQLVIPLPKPIYTDYGSVISSPTINVTTGIFRRTVVAYATAIN